MADKIVGPNQGVPMGDGNGGQQSSSGQQTQGGGQTTGQTGGQTGGTSSPSAGTGVDPFEQNLALVKQVVDGYLAAGAIAYGINEVIELYVDNKLGFKNLKAKYLKDNPDLTDEEKKQVEDAIAQERAKAVEHLTEGAGKDAFQKKFDDFKLASAEAFNNLKDLLSEMVKGFGESAMPNVIGPVAPNPFSIALKVYNTLSRIKKTLDRAFIALKVFMTTAEALGLDQAPPPNPYRAFINQIGNKLKPIQDKINAKENDPSYKQQLELGEALQSYKDNWKGGIRADGQTFTALEVEDLAREDDFKIYTFPADEDSRKKLRNYADYKQSNQEKITRKLNAELILKYDDYLKWAYNQLTEANEAFTATQDEPSMGGKAPGNTGGGAGYADGNSDSSSSDSTGGGSDPNLDINLGSK